MKARLLRLSLAAALAGALLLPGCSRAPAPAAAPGLAARVFEMRTYTTHEGKLADLERRFRDHTTRLFEKHGMTNVGYWIPRDSANTLVYILAYPSRDAAVQSWAGFRADPDWVAARTASEAAGPIVRGVQSVFMDPTDYSPMR